MNIVLGCLSFRNLTGSEIYFYELGKALQKAGHHIEIYAGNVGKGKLAELAEREKVKLVAKDINAFDKDCVEKIDAVICSHPGITDFFIDLKNNREEAKYCLIDVCQQEYSEYGQPNVNDAVDYYVGIRPAIYNRLINHYEIPTEKASMIWNPFDISRFTRNEVKEFDFENGKDYNILMCGTVDKVRKPIIYDMAKFCKGKGWTFTLVGDNCDDYLNDLLKEYVGTVRYFEATNDVEKHIHECNATCGMYIGRTTIEGWLCGVPGFVYNLNENFNISDIMFYNVPKDLSVFDEKNTAEQYINIINKLKEPVRVVVPLTGRLGNNLFQISAGQTMMKKCGAQKLEVYPYAMALGNVINPTIERAKLEIYQRGGGEIDDSWVVYDEGFWQKPVDLKGIHKNVLMTGLWQSEKYLDKELVRKTQKCSPEEEKKIFEEYGDLTDYVGISVRRGDFLQRSDSFIVPTKDWYLRCYQKYFNGKKAIVSSDDIEWCKENIKIDGAVYIEGHKPFETLLILSQCKDHIIDTSTFGWWSAWLNEKEDSKIVTCDRSWNYICPIASADRIPDRWIREPLYDDVENPVEIPVALCAIGKGENHYIREWVEHYKKIGFKRIVLYDNNDVDGERFEDVIGDYIDSGFVKLEDVRGEKEIQLKVYQDFYNRNCRSLYSWGWYAFFDCDEFLELDEKYASIGEMLKDPKYEGFDAILPCWKNYDDNGLTKVENGNYSRIRFTHVMEQPGVENRIFKTMIRGGLPEIEFTNPHFPNFVDKNIVMRKCDINGKEFTGSWIVLDEEVHRGGSVSPL